MQVMKNGKIRRTKAEWREIFSRCKESGLGAQDFCRQEEINLASFRRWREKLNASLGSGEFVTVKAPEPATSLPATSSPSLPSWTVEVSLPNGCRFRLQG